jgi:hypothetical protein
LVKDKAPGPQPQHPIETSQQIWTVQAQQQGPRRAGKIQQQS